VASGSFAVVAENLRKRYGGKYALDGFSLTVQQGTVCGLLGPNGAGKTTSVRILSTLVKLDEGQAAVGGYDVASQAREVRKRIGLVGQNAAVDEVLSGFQNLAMFGRLYHLGAKAARVRAGEMLERFGLADTGTKPVKAYSGGMRRRLDLAASMMLAPAVLFMDEPTVGLDPRGRNEVWQAVRELVSQGTTVLLTTQHLDEADQLASQISVIDTGKVIAEGTPSQLKSLIGGDRVEFVVHDDFQLQAAAKAVTGLGLAEPVVNRHTRQVSVQVEDKSTAIVQAVRLLDEAGVAVDDLALRRPTLDEVFLHLTGHKTECTETA
jgi:ABC-2 type transport system ATP-binding protein